MSCVHLILLEVWVVVKKIGKKEIVFVISGKKCIFICSNTKNRRTIADQAKKNNISGIVGNKTPKVRVRIINPALPQVDFAYFFSNLPPIKPAKRPNGMDSSVNPIKPPQKIMRVIKNPMMPLAMTPTI